MSWWSIWVSFVILIYAQNPLQTAIFTLKNDQFDFCRPRKTSSLKRQKMAIIAAIMVINGNTGMATNSRSICAKYTAPSTEFQMPFRDFQRICDPPKVCLCHEGEKNVPDCVITEFAV